MGIIPSFPSPSNFYETLRKIFFGLMLYWYTHCILRPVNIPFYSWEHAHCPAIAGKYMPSSNPCYGMFFLSYSWPFSQLFPAIAGICPRFSLVIVPVLTWELSQLFIQQCRREHCLSKTAIFTNVSLVQFKWALPL